MRSIRSNAFEASKNTACTCEPWITRYEAILLNKNVHWSELWPALKPNWLSVVPRKGKVLDNMKCSRSFDKTGFCHWSVIWYARHIPILVVAHRKYCCVKQELGIYPWTIHILNSYVGCASLSLEKNEKIMRWRMQLSEFDFEIVFRPGKLITLPNTPSTAVVPKIFSFKAHFR